MKRLSTLSVVLLASCAATGDPDNIETKSGDYGYQAQYRDIEVSRADAGFLKSARLNSEICLPYRGGAYGTKVSGVANTLLGERLSRNDLVEVRIGNDEDLGGNYVVSRDGTLKIPYLPPIRAQGRSTADVERDLNTILVEKQLYDTAPLVSVRVMDVASALVGVSGAVFEPHQVELGGIAGDQRDVGRQEALGASTEARNLSAALRATGGVRPDADLSAVELRRNGRLYTLDLRGVFQGHNMVDVMLLTGDQVFVPSRQCFQDDLMRPSPVSPPGVTVFMSNLTQPATGNAISAIGRNVREMPYGTRYLQAILDLNCVGGARASSAHRSGLLLSRNPMTEVSVAIERDIEDMLRRADRDDYDPYILPGDAVACYDSTLTNVAEVARVLGVIGVGLLLNE
ncbi:polysaccharide biosynthesis protein [Parasedimentitalea maritima]|uniref:Polysaccharide biosynthesis protein n=1 Tax=Parasedimentitalea maritima TaxID=2578117 RepID=A0ABY2V4D5_9RHOB|nr:polysaccharide biosynthesis/export family protein [Zongyanglinia marina]TLP68028.1 polysaccharide biosynthesis protein [Zongyanglinia marina]